MEVIVIPGTAGRPSGATPSRDDALLRQAVQGLDISGTARAKLIHALRNMLTITSFPELVDDPVQALGDIGNILSRALEAACDQQLPEVS